MALFHRATITPTKAEIIADWAPTRPWGQPNAAPLEVIGSYRFDDPEGRVGMETHLVTAGGVLLQVPLTYRDEPLEKAEDALITKMQHSVLGTRWVYDGLQDPHYVTMLAEVDSDDATASVLHNDCIQLTLFRRPAPGPRPVIGLTATWDGQHQPVVLAEVVRR
jgi:Maltokinase N-terminal cap domain